MRFLIALLIIFGLDTRQFLARGAVTACVPHYSMSGGTLTALAANEIVMCQQSILGPIDLQVGSLPAASLIKAINQKPIAAGAVASVLSPIKKMTAVNDYLPVSDYYACSCNSTPHSVLGRGASCTPHCPSRHRARKREGGSGKSAVESVIVRNRFSRPTGRRKADFLRQLASRPGFGAIDGLPEREAHEAFVPHGLTALDDAHEVASAIELESVAEMREEVRSFVETLKLPIDELQRKRAASRRMVCFTRQAD
jgi:hypothetical protein